MCHMQAHNSLFTNQLLKSLSEQHGDEISQADLLLCLLSCRPPLFFHFSPLATLNPIAFPKKLDPWPTRIVLVHANTCGSLRDAFCIDRYDVMSEDILQRYFLGGRLFRPHGPDGGRLWIPTLVVRRVG